MLKIISEAIITNFDLSLDIKKADKPHVVVLLDASGSMASQRESVVSTFNEFVNSVKETAHTISLYTFDSTGVREKLYKIHPSRVPELTTKNYQPDALTPLYDSMGLVMKKFQDSDRNVQFVTHTDGQENNSIEWSYDGLQRFIQKLTKKGWLFVYLGENNIGQTALRGFSGLKVNFSAATRGAAMASVGQTTAKYASSGSNDLAGYTGSNSDTIDIDAGQQIAGSTPA